MRGFYPAIFIATFGASMLLTAVGFGVVERPVILVIAVVLYRIVIAGLNGREGDR